MTERIYNKPTNPMFNDLTNQTFNRWKVISFAFKERTVKGYRPYWNCECECGNLSVISGTNLKQGYSKSCGCYKDDNPSRLTHGMGSHPLYSRCANQIARCHKPDHPDYKNYGGRGIEVCNEWRESLKLMILQVEDEIGLPTFNKADIDRIDNSKGYQAGNIRWSNREENNRNTRINHNHAASPVSKKRTPTYSAWGRMLRIYKGEVCIEWMTDRNPESNNGFKQFYLDMGSKPEGRHPIKRHDESKPFCRRNCFWK